MMRRILVADDDPLIREHLRVILEADGHDVETVGDGLTALEAVRHLPYWLLLADSQLPGLDGPSLLATVRAEEHPIGVILLAGPTDRPNLPDALRAGADEFITKPYEPEHLRRVVARVLIRERRRRERVRLGRPDHAADVPEGFVACSPAMRRVAALVQQLGPLGVPLLIAGEPGTGREFVARAVHAADPARRGPFRVVSASSDPADWPTGLGTCFLDDLVALTPAAQAALADRLRADLAEGFDRRKAPRFLAATSRRLDAEAAAGLFHPELLAHFREAQVELPPLRERIEDVPGLARRLLAEACAGRDAPPPELAADALYLLMEHPWPGNLHELRAALARAIASDVGPVLTREALSLRGDEATPAPEGRPLIDTARPLPALKDDLIGRVERTYFTRLLERYRGNVARCANHSGLSRKSVNQKLEKYALDRNAYKDGPPA